MMNSLTNRLPVILAALMPLTAAIPAVAEDGHSESTECSRETFQSCLNGVSSSVTNGAGLRVSGSGYGGVASERSGREAEDAQTASTLFSTGTLAAGDAEQGSVFAMWGSYSYADFDSDFAFAGTSLAYDAHAHNVLGGIDRLFAGRYLVGLAGGWQSVDSDTDFNGGGQDNDGYTIAPYVAVLLTDIFSVDATAGYSWLDYDQDRISPADGTDIEASFDAERWFAATNLNALMTFGNWVFGAKVGYLYTDEQQDGYLETGSAASAAAARLRTVRTRNIDLSQGVVGGDIGYSFGRFEPYVMALYRNDLSRDDGESAGGLPVAFTSVQPDDDDEVEINVGVRYYTTWGVSGAIEYSRVEGRQDFDSDTFMFTLRAAL